MKVILQEDVRKLGKTGEIVEVADGYGRNYLIPRGFAVEATEANLRTLRESERHHRRREEQDLDGARRLAAALQDVSITIAAKAGDTGRLFGSVTTADIARAIKKAAGHDVDRRKIELDEPIRELGRHDVEIRLHPAVTVTVGVEVTADG